MIRNISRRTLVKGAASAAAGAAVIGAPSQVFGAPARIQGGGSNTEIILWTSFGSGVNGDAQAKLVKDFNAQGNGVTVKAEPYESYEAVAQQLITGLETGDIPTLAVLSDVWWFSFYLRQSLLDLTDMVDTPDDYQKSLYVEYQRNDGQWAVPFARSTPLFYFNRDALKKAGLEESVFKKWSDFAKAAPDFIKGGGIQAAFGFGNAASYGAWTMHGPVWAFGGHYSDPDFNILVAEDGAVDCGNFMREFVQSKSAKAVADPQTDFQTGLFGAAIMSTGSLGAVTEASKFDFGTAFLPEEIQFGCCTGGSGLGIMKDASEEQQKAAMEFITFCTNTENASYWAQTTGYMPVRTSAVESKDFQAFLDKHPNNKVAIEQLPKTQPQDSARVFIPNGDQILGRGWEQVLVKNVDAKDAFSEVKSQLDEAKAPVLEAIKQIEG